MKKIMIAGAAALLLAGCSAPRHTVVTEQAKDSAEQEASQPEPEVKFSSAPPKPREKVNLLDSNNLALEAKAAVGNRLKDPYSAKFTDLYGVKRSGTDEFMFVCGRVNAKNSYGGYTGSVPFVYTPGNSESNVILGSASSTGFGAVDNNLIGIACR